MRDEQSHRQDMALARKENQRFPVSKRHQIAGIEFAIELSQSLPALCHNRGTLKAK
ncbi:MAG: hypothetical protein IPJ71_06060 [Bdellovibrionales bacterium]|nr:hypothetical protein [Bdellovibrionales bacterium]